MGKSITTLQIMVNGQLGNELRQAFRDHDLVSLTHGDFELRDPAQTRELFHGYRPELIFDTGAYHRIDECEDHRLRAFAVNTLAVRDLVIVAKEIGAVLVHFSMDYVLEGRQRPPYG